MKFWPSKKGAIDLSEELRGALFTMFGVESKDTAPMRYVSKSGRLGSGRVNRVCIFDPATLSGPELAGCNYESMMNLNKGLLFTGHVLAGSQNTAGEGMAFLYDQRVS